MVVEEKKAWILVSAPRDLCGSYRSSDVLHLPTKSNKALRSWMWLVGKETHVHNGSLFFISLLGGHVGGFGDGWGFVGRVARLQLSEKYNNTRNVK